MHGNPAMCDGKKAFPTWFQARDSARRMRRRDSSPRANPYKCPSCGKFHVGNTGKMRRRRTNRHNMKGYLEHGRIKIPN